jgi:ABC-type glycerol-3-phosphate transport system substrate-binding protein
MVALNRSDLEAAALKGLVYPIDGLTAVVEDSDWYPYARELARVQNSTFGLPFAGDALVLVNRTAEGQTAIPGTWPELLAENRLIIFPADDNQGLVTLALYRSTGGLVQDLQGRPNLDADFLQQVLQNDKDGIGRGSFPVWLTQLQTMGQAWQAFMENQGSGVITWSSNYLADLPPDASIAPLPSLGSSPFTLATGWCWALTDTDPLRRESTLKLMEFLTDSEFLAQLTEASRFLPTRPTALTVWTNQSLQPILNQVLLAAEVRPANELLASL